MALNKEYETKIPDEKWHITWTIENFIFWKNPCGAAITSSKFKMGPTGEHWWFLKFFPNGDSSEKEVGMYLSSSFESSTTAVSVQFSLALLNTKNEKICLQSYSTFFSGTNICGSSKFVARTFILDTNNGLLQNGHLRIHLEAKFPSFKDVSKISCIHMPLLLSDDINNLFNSGKHTDVTIKVGEEAFKAHKAILASRSPVFRAMFEHPLEENKTNIVDIVDTEPVVMEEVLRYIYSGFSPKIRDFAADILPIADKYCLEELKKITEEVLLTRLEVENAARMLVLAHTYNLPLLKEKTISFINLNGKEVISTSGWSSVASEHELMLELYSSIVDKCVVADTNINLYCD